jgi:hypothetical protein
MRGGGNPTEPSQAFGSGWNEMSSSLRRTSQLHCLVASRSYDERVSVYTWLYCEKPVLHC